jgi:hypothetical protein
MAIELTTATTQQLSGIRQSLGFPQIIDVFPNGKIRLGSFGFNMIDNSYGSIVNFKNFNKMPQVLISGPSDSNYKVTTILNAQDLENLEDQGTSGAVDLSNNSLSETALNQFFTDLPATNKTVTIRVVGNPGAATCDTSIATNKGYTVVTS